MRIVPIAFAAMALMTYTLAQAADVYRWTDDKGVTHFADAPPQGVKYERVNARSGSSTASTSDEAQDKAKAEAEAEEAANKAERCRIANSNLTNLRAGVAMIVDGGQARYLTEDEQKTQIADNERAVKDNCVSNPSGV